MDTLIDTGRARQIGIGVQTRLPCATDFKRPTIDPLFNTKAQITHIYVWLI
jgi:hypothetical protein